MDQSGFTSMLSRHEPALRKYAMKLTGDYDDANDLYQDTCLRGWSFLHQFKEGTNEAAWLSVIMRNSFINGFRKVRATPEMLDYNDVYYIATPIFSEKDKALSDRMTRALNGLSNEYRFLFTMSHVEGYTDEELAALASIPKGTVKSRLHRGKMYLQQVLG